MTGQMNLEKHIAWVINAHQNCPAKPSKAYRKHDEKTPYFFHPLWCATTIATETKLDEKTKIEGCLALLYHDVLEDTTAPLPENLDTRIVELVREMTFDGMADEEQRIWDKPKEVRLYKLYDKVNNLMDGSWMSSEKNRHYRMHAWRLMLDVLENYGELNITKIAKEIVE